MFGAPASPSVVQLAPGASGSTVLQAYSTAPLAAPMSVHADSLDSDITVSLDASSAVNGQVLGVSLHAAATAASGSLHDVIVTTSVPDYTVYSVLQVKVP